MYLHQIGKGTKFEFLIYQKLPQNSDLGELKNEINEQ